MKKKSRISIVPFIVMGFVLMLTNSCKKEEINNPHLPANAVTDVDGNVYHTVTIGTQVWMLENLKTTKYRNGDTIPNITGGTTWGNLKTAAYCNYDNNQNNSTTYGRLYNWYAVNDSRSIAPGGWHVPSDSEWTILTTYLGGERIAGGKIKEQDSIHWQSPNAGATNESGFTALPGGFCGYDDGSFQSIKSNGHWWSSTESSLTACAWFRWLRYDHAIVYRNDYDKAIGFSVRCVKD